GAGSGGVFVLGAVFGRGEHDERSATERTYAKVRDLIIRFEGRQGCLECRDLLGGCDISTEAGHKHHVASGLRDRVCGSCVRFAAEIVEELLRAPPHPAASKAP
ncbi:MAG: C-GCAxxG-C-C family protein, partial [Planctomycetota bacterium]